jgi:hypothetical protein
MRSETDFHNYRNSSVLFELWANYGNYGNLFPPLWKIVTLRSQGDVQTLLATGRKKGVSAQALLLHAIDGTGSGGRRIGR